MFSQSIVLRFLFLTSIELLSLKLKTPRHFLKRHWSSFISIIFPRIWSKKLNTRSLGASMTQMKMRRSHRSSSLKSLKACSDFGGSNLPRPSHRSKKRHNHPRRKLNLTSKLYTWVRVPIYSWKFSKFPNWKSKWWVQNTFGKLDTQLYLTIFFCRLMGPFTSLG